MKIDKIDLDAVYGVSECPFCWGSGIVHVCVDDNSALYLECDECFTQWSEPQAVLLNMQGFRDKYTFHHYAWYEEVEEIGWVEYIKIIDGGLYYSKVYPMFRDK